MKPGDLVVGIPSASGFGIFAHIKASSDDSYMCHPGLAAHFGWNATNRVGEMTPETVSVVVGIQTVLDHDHPVQVSIITSEGILGWVWSDYLRVIA